MSLPRFLRSFSWICVFVSSLFLFSRISIHAAPPQHSSYHIIRKAVLGGDGGWDYLTVDSEARRIYISRGTHVIVVDENSLKQIGDIPNTKGVHGIALAKDLGKGFISDGGANSVTEFEIATLKTVATIDVSGQNPDSILYDPQSKRVFTFNGRSSNATAIDAETGKVVGTIALPGKPETPVLDGKGKIFVNIEDKNSLTELDAKTLAVEHTYAMEGCEGPSGIAMDTKTRRIFSGCSDSKVMAVTDADTGKQVARPPIGEDVDADRFDPATKLAFASCREGVLSIIHEDSPDKYSVAGNVKTEFGARTMGLDTKTHHVFVVTSDLKPGTASADNPHPRPVPVPGTFRIIELGE